VIMEDFEFETELTFSGVSGEMCNGMKREYIFSVVVIKLGTFDASYRLVVDCEDKWTGEIWRGEFKHPYVEEMTIKAKNPKQFAVFVKMIVSAAKHESQELIIDLLSQHDLELLRQRKTGDKVNPSPNDNPRQNKYLILTMRGEYDKTHYPLLLPFLQEPDIQTVRRTFMRLQ
jgi:hypothetical protein